MKRPLRHAAQAAPHMSASRALDMLLSSYRFSTVLDVGCGDGSHARRFAAAGKRVTTLSFERYGGFEPDFIGDFFAFPVSRAFDMVWCSHMLEHQRDVGRFLERLISLAKPGGILAITVPPARDSVVGGHVTLWNTGLLLYNLVLAGLDCRDAKALEYGYNISVIVRRRLANLPALRHDAGDIEALARFFPLPVKQRFDGRIAHIAWRKEALDLPPAGEPLEPGELDTEAFRAWPAPFRSDVAALVWSAQCVHIAGHALQVGVPGGDSFAEIARVLDGRQVHRFDSPQELSGWLAAHSGDVALVHIAATALESASAALALLDERIVSGTVIAFQRLCDWRERGTYPAWPQWRALSEWMRERRRAARVLCRGPDCSGSIALVQPGAQS